MHKSVRFAGVAMVLVATLLMAACATAPRVSDAPSNPNTHGYPTYSPSTYPQANTKACTPAPCAEYEGATLSFQIAVPNVQPGQYDPTIPPGSYYISISLSVKNQGTQPVNVNPYDFKLQDPSGAQKSASYYGETCNNFDAESVAPGGDVGPLPMCFNPSGNPGDKLILIWDPDPLAGPAQIALN